MDRKVLLGCGFKQRGLERLHGEAAEVVLESTDQYAKHLACRHRFDSDWHRTGTIL
jgi:outer membrane lipopolysaccharide assembly protein LptE/RlpB